MTVFLAGLCGACVVFGLTLVVVGLVPTTRPLRSQVRRVRRSALRGSGWTRRRWPVGLAVGVVVWAFTRWPVAGAVATAAVVGLPVLLSTASLAARQISRIEAIEEWTRRLADVVATGTGLEQAIVVAARTAPTLLDREVGALVARLAARWPTEGALRAFADDLDDGAGDLVVAALVLAARRRGPGLAKVLTAVADSVAEDVAARRRIEAERATPRTTARAVTLITLVVAAVGLFNGAYLAPYGTVTGQAALAIIASGFIGCLLWMRALTLSRPEPRFLSQRRDAEPQEVRS